jgi:hypothetical protein
MPYADILRPFRAFSALKGRSSLAMGKAHRYRRTSPLIQIALQDITHTRIF